MKKTADTPTQNRHRETSIDRDLAPIALGTVAVPEEGLEKLTRGGLGHLPDVSCDRERLEWE